MGKYVTRLCGVDDRLVPDTASDCPNRAAHEPCPAGYMEFTGWALEKARTHEQEKCQGCGLLKIWRPVPLKVLEVHPPGIKCQSLFVSRENRGHAQASVASDGESIFVSVERRNPDGKFVRAEKTVTWGELQDALLLLADPKAETWEEAGG